MNKCGAKQIACRTNGALAPDAAMPNQQAGIWKNITEAYERARAMGAAYKTDTNLQLLRDPSYDIQFVLRVAAALRDKPKPSKGG